MSPIVIPEFSSSPTFTTQAALEALVSVEGSWSALTSFAVAGLGVKRYGNSLYYVGRYLGEPNVPADIRRLRRSVHEVMRRMGQPVIVKHMFNDRDRKLGLAQATPVGLSAYGGQTRSRDPYSYGTGFCSVQLSPNEWIDPVSGSIVTDDLSPGPEFVKAPFYRGYGPGFLTYLIEPDVAVDLFKLSSAGAIIKTQSQTVVSGWFPEINDNDLLINVELDRDGLVANTAERYQAKRTGPVSIRGLDRRGRREYTADPGNRHVVNQHFEMSALIETSPLQLVETDR